MSVLIGYIVTLISLTGSISFAVYGFPECPGGHCSQFSKEINNACIAAGMSGKPFPVVGPNGSTCTCPCSCVVSGTLLSMENQSLIPIESSVKDQFVFNPFTQEYQSQVAMTTRSPVTRHKIIQLTFSDDSYLLASGNHTLIRPGGIIVSAEKLKLGDQVLNDKGQKITVIGRQYQNYSGNLHNIIINPKSSLIADHIIVLNKLLSGDLLVQEANDQIKNEINLRMNVVKPLNLNEEKKK